MNPIAYSAGSVRAIVTVLALCVLPGLTAAQRITTTLDVTRVSLRHDSISSVATALTPMLRVDGYRGTFALAGTLSRFENAGWTSQGGAHGAVFVPIHGVVIGELAGNAEGSAHDGGAATAQLLAQGRLHLMGAKVGGWGGGGMGRGWDGVHWRALRLGEGGLWLRSGPAIALAVFTPTVVDDSIRFADAELALRMGLRRLELGATMAMRSGDRLFGSDADPRSWGSVGAAAWFAPWGAVTANAGVLPLDFAQGYPGGRYASVGLRLGNRPGGAAADQRKATAIQERHIAASRRHGLGSLVVERQSAGRQRLAVFAPDARAVELMGDFTGWRPRNLARGADGWWSIALPVASGTHHVNMRVDGGEWLVPPGLPVAVDEFGVVTGLVVVP